MLSSFNRILFVTVLFCFPVNAQILTPKMVVDMKTVASVSIQPQGDYIAYTLRMQRGAHEKPGGARSELWVVASSGGDARAYVSRPHSVSSIGWTPDGKTITFISLRESVNKHRQVYAIPLNGGEAKQLSHAPRSISGYALSPDGKQLAYSMLDEEPKDEQEAKKTGFDQLVVDTWSRVRRIYAEDLYGGKMHFVTQSDLHVWDFRWTPDGKSIIYRASERPFSDDNYLYTDNYIVSAKGGEGELIHDTVGKVGLASMSPDGKYTAWLGAVSFNDAYTGSLFILASGGGSPKNLLQGFEGNGSSFTWKDSKTILLTTFEKTRTYLYEVSIPGGKMKRLRGAGGPVFGGVSLSKDGKKYTATGNDADHPNEVYAGTSDGKILQRLTHSNPELEGMQFGEQETISWKGPDDLVIYGVLVKPVNYNPAEKYPLQVQIHGGPETIRLDGWNTFYSRYGQLLAQRGYMVLIPNYRGSLGRGVAFTKEQHNDFMGKEFEDILAGIDYLIDQNMADPERIGIGGGSYGGYASAWAATKHSDRFKASVVFVGISNQISKGGMSDNPAENAIVHWNFWTYDNFDLVWDRSPLKHVKNAKTPTLILHGERDRRVPLNQAYELYRGLKYVKVPTELIVYPREGHGNRERAHQLDLCRRALEWYDKYLKEKAKATSYVP